MNPLIKTDFYKTGHHQQYPIGTTEVYSNFTARSAKHFKWDIDNKIVNFGVQAVLMEMHSSWDTEFFQLPFEEAVQPYIDIVTASLGISPEDYDVTHLKKLHDMGYLPLQIKALPEGALVNIGVPILTVKNTVDHAFWLVNYIETTLSANLWKLCTSATTAYAYKKILTDWAEKTGGNRDFVTLQGHDFSYRGMSGDTDAAMTGMGHLTSFMGTDTIPAIYNAKKFYAATGPVGLSVPATEHSVMTSNIIADFTNEQHDQHYSEKETIRRLINEVYPTGIVSIVADSFDFWDVISNISLELKDDILARKPNDIGLAKVVFRPDSGDPVDIICGDLNHYTGKEANSPEYKGAVECLWDIFGGTVNDKGYKELHERVGLIYGDSITMERANQICERLEAKGFASTNVVFGIGSYTYQGGGV